MVLSIIVYRMALWPVSWGKEGREKGGEGRAEEGRGGEGTVFDFIILIFMFLCVCIIIQLLFVT